MIDNPVPQEILFVDHFTHPNSNVSAMKLLEFSVLLTIF
jgi:hypothetical protein